MAEHCDSGQAGFTLVELLVALLVFALLAAAGIALLRGGVEGQRAVRGHLDALADVQLLRGTMEADLAQATVRVTRTAAGTLAPAFYAEGASAPERNLPLMEFVRLGWSNPDLAPRPTVQKVSYYWRDGRIERVGQAWLDGAPPLEPALLIDGVTGLTLRFRNNRGEWQSQWHPRAPDQFPRLVEMTLSRRNGPPLTLRFAVGPGGREAPVTAALPSP